MKGRPPVEVHTSTFLLLLPLITMYLAGFSTFKLHPFLDNGSSIVFEIKFYNGLQKGAVVYLKSVYLRLLAWTASVSSHSFTYTGLHLLQDHWESCECLLAKRDSVVGIECSWKIYFGGSCWLLLYNYNVETRCYIVLNYSVLYCTSIPVCHFLEFSCVHLIWLWLFLHPSNLKSRWQQLIFHGWEHGPQLCSEIAGLET